MRTRLPDAMVVSLLLSGCGLGAHLEGAHLGCADGLCPASEVCVEQTCYALDELSDAGLRTRDADLDPPDADRTARPDASSTAPLDAAPIQPDAEAPPPTAPCNPVSLIADSFDAARVQAQWGAGYADPGTAVTQVNGRLRITLPTQASSSVHAGVVSSRFFDLNEGRVHVEVPHMVNTASSAAVYLQVFHRHGSSIQAASIYQRQGRLYFRSSVGTSEILEDIAYDPVQQRFWQLRARAGVLYWETSPDGSTWTTRRSSDAPFDLSLVRVELGASVAQPESAPGFAELENLNGGVASGSYCKIATLSDDFDDGVRNDRWARSYATSSCTIAEAGGTFVGTPPSPAMQEVYCGYESAAAFDLVSSQVAVQVTQMLDTAGAARAYFKLADDLNQHGVELTVASGKLDCRRWAGGTPTSLGTATWNATTMRFWRLAEAGGQIRWQTSPDGTAWVTRCNAPTSSVDVANVELTFGAGVTGAAATGAPAPGSFKLDRLNLVP